MNGPSGFLVNLAELQFGAMKGEPKMGAVLLERRALVGWSPTHHLFWDYLAYMAWWLVGSM